MSNIPTSHNKAKKGEVAKNVIMTGDPIRCKKFAEKYLTNAQLVSDVRGALCYTGLYKDKKITFMTSGMGNASMGIYTYELFAYYGVEKIIRLGTCGGKNGSFSIGDIIASKSVITDTNYRNYVIDNGNKALICNSELLNKAKESAKRLNLCLVEGTTFSTDTFYDNTNPNHELCDNVEMESGALYINANLFNKKALCICIVSDILGTNKKTSSGKREEYVDDVVRLGLESLI